MQSKFWELHHQSLRHGTLIPLSDHFRDDGVTPDLIVVADVKGS